MTKPIPFQVGDRVSDPDGERIGTVCAVIEWSDFHECYRYRVAQDCGVTHYRLGSNLVRA